MHSFEKDHDGAADDWRVHRDLRTSCIVAWVALSEATAPVSSEHDLQIFNYPNPFNPYTSIRFALPKDSKVHLSVYDVVGRLVSTLVDGWRDAGMHNATLADWD